MSASHTSTADVTHTIAEILSFPFSSESSLTLALSELDPRMRGCTGPLWRAAEKSILASTNGLSVDEAVIIRDSWWFEEMGTLGAESAIPLGRVLGGISRRLLAASGPMARPIRATGTGGLPEREACLARLAFRWVSLALPMDLLLAAHPGGPSQVEVVDPVLRRTLADDGFAEVHQHLATSVTFEDLWSVLQGALLDRRALSARWFSPGAEFGEGRDLLEWLLRAAVGRLVLWWDMSGLGRGPTDSFQSGIDTLICRLTLDQGALVASHFTHVVRDLCRGRIGRSSPGVAAVQAVYKEVCRLCRPGMPGGLRSAGRWSDPLRMLDPMRSTFTELSFIRAGLRRLEVEGQNDKDRCCFFWQCQRVRNRFFRHVTQRPLTAGMQWFVRFCDRADTVSEFMSAGELLGSAARLTGAGRGLRSLEVRKAPSPKKSKLEKFLASTQRAALRLRVQYPDLEIGTVLHLPRIRGGDAQRGLPSAHGCGTNADPGSSRRGPRTVPYRHGAQYLQLRGRIRALADVLRDWPLVLNFVRGVDVCTDELSTPVWVIAPLIRWIRDVAAYVALAFAGRSGRTVPELRATIHAGEDFVHLLGGFRRLAETIHECRLVRGDRIGHGGVLGVSVSDWCRSSRQVPVAREERLFDLLWEYSWYCEGRVGPDSGRLKFVEAEILRLGRLVFGEFGDCLENVVALRRQLFDASSLAATRFPSGPPPESVRGDPSGVGRYLCSTDWFRRGQIVEWVDTVRESDALQTLQGALRRLVAGSGVFVEVNPTSNLLIGNLCDLERHPVWRMSRPQGNDSPVRIGTVCGSDNICTFATTLPQEFQLLCDTLVVGGESVSAAHSFVDRMRLDGLRARFTTADFHLDFRRMRGEVIDLPYLL